jgi:Tfp pilus assembly protein FimT
MDRRGFTVLETLVVVGVAAIVTVTALPKMTNAIANARMRASLTSLSGLFQNTRMVAVQQNKTKTARFAGGSGSGLVGYIKDAGDTSAYTTLDVQIEMEAPILKLTTPSGVGAPTAITNTELGFTPDTDEPSFNSRGLPCEFSSGTCTVKGFIYYFKDNRVGTTGAWAAISISPAGRIRRWFWTGAAWAS